MALNPFVNNDAAIHEDSYSLLAKEATKQFKYFVHCKSGWDTIYFQLFDSKPGKIKKVGDFDIWWELNSEVLSHNQFNWGRQHGPVIANIRCQQSDYRIRFTVHDMCQMNNPDLDKNIPHVRVFNFWFYDYNIKGNLLNSGCPSLVVDLFFKEICALKSAAKKEHNKRLAQIRKEKIQASGLSPKEYREREKTERLAKKQKAAADNKLSKDVKHVNGLLKLAPLVNSLKEEIDIVAKQFAAGAGDTRWQRDKEVRLLEAIRLMQSLQTKT